MVLLALIMLMKNNSFSKCHGNDTNTWETDVWHQYTIYTVVAIMYFQVAQNLACISYLRDLEKDIFCCTVVNLSVMSAAAVSNYRAKKHAPGCQGINCRNSVVSRALNDYEHFWQYSFLAIALLKIKWNNQNTFWVHILCCFFQYKSDKIANYILDWQ